MTKIAIIGTGFSALVLANELNKNRDFQITLFEKSRGVGGRIATCYHESWEFDHGCPFFEAKNSQFIDFLSPLIKSGIIAKWKPKIIDNLMSQINEDTEYFIGIPKMNSIGKYLAKDLDVKLETKIIKMEYRQNKWHLIDDKYKEYGAFDFVVTANPPLQAVDILPFNCFYLESLKAIKMFSTFAVMLGFDENIVKNQSWDVMNPQNSKIERIIANHNKTFRKIKPSFVIHTSYAWAKENVDMDKDEVGKEVLSEIEYLLNIKLQPKILQTHRWLYSKPKDKSDELFLSDDNLKILSCGDWLSTGTIEGAFLSGMKTVHYILEK